jgi:SAM-dependent methyltransferase
MTGNGRDAACPACGGARIGFGAEKDGFRFDECADCRFLFLNPRPVQSELNDLYKEEESAAEPTFDKVASRLRRAWLKLPRFLPYAWRADVLDLGCGGGFTAHALSLIARSATGIDINRNAVEYARARFRRPRYDCLELSALADDPRTFDFIHSSEMIEHVADVNLYLRVLARMCRRDGRVYITTPDRGHRKVPRNVAEWDVFCPPVHVQFFTRESATALFGRHGFEILRFYRNRKPGLQFLARRTD